MKTLLNNGKATAGVVMVAVVVIIAAVGPIFLGDPNAFVGIPSNTGWARRAKDRMYSRRPWPAHGPRCWSPPQSAWV